MWAGLTWAYIRIKRSLENLPSKEKYGLQNEEQKTPLEVTTHEDE